MYGHMSIQTWEKQDWKTEKSANKCIFYEYFIIIIF